MLKRVEPEQLELWPEILEEERRLPWGGRSPRSLTLTGFPEVLFLRQEPQKSVSDLVSLTQLEIWPTGKKSPPIYRGAPLLGSLFSQEG